MHSRGIQIRRTGCLPSCKVIFLADITLIHVKSRFLGLLIVVAPRYRYCSGAAGATFIIAVAVAQLLLIEKNGDGSAATFSLVFGATRYCYFGAQTIYILGVNCIKTLKWVLNIVLHVVVKRCRSWFHLKLTLIIIASDGLSFSLRGEFQVCLICIVIKWMNINGWIQIQA